MTKILITGSSGQLGTDLIEALAQKHGQENLIGLDLHESRNGKDLGCFEQADATNKQAVEDIIKKHDVKQVYHLASLLSASGEKNPDLAWEVNMSSLKHILDLAKEYGYQIFWPSSIAAFGPSTPKNQTPQATVLDPNTMYGITKITGELLCNYYFEKWGVDTRSVRYPGLISYRTLPGGGTTDYAVEMYYEALKGKKYTCFVREDTALPMMYMPDAVKGAIEILEAPAKGISIRQSYNLTAMSFKAKELEEEIKKHVPGFECTYKPDERQEIADSWPKSVDDSRARVDWGWKPDYDLAAMTVDMLQKLKEKGITREVE